MFAFAEMPDLLVMEVTEEDAAGSIRCSSFCCPIALHVKKHVGRHDGIHRALTFIVGVPYKAEPDAVAFMDDVDAGRPVSYPRTVTFRRRRPLRTLA